MKQTTDFLPIKGTDYIEFYVGNSKAGCIFLSNCLWFSASCICRTWKLALLTDHLMWLQQGKDPTCIYFSLKW
jgi:hypothetical protein